MRTATTCLTTLIIVGYSLVGASCFGIGQQGAGGGGVNPPVPQTAPPTAPMPAVKQIGVPPVPIIRNGFPELMIAGKAVMRLRATAGGLTPDERASDLRRRLGPILTLPDLTAADVTIYQERPRQTASIYVRNRLLIMVDRNLAKANDSSIGNLAQQWAHNLQEALPQVNIAVRMFDPLSGAIMARPSR